MDSEYVFLSSLRSFPKRGYTVGAVISVEPSLPYLYGALSLERLTVRSIIYYERPTNRL